jgi:hypothetical protein
MSTLAVKMTIIRMLTATWTPNFEAAQKELFHYGALAIAGEYA